MENGLTILFSLLAIFLLLVYISFSETEDDFRTCGILGIAYVNKVNFKDFESVSVAANMLY